MEEKLRTSAEKRLEGMADELPFDREKMTLAVSRGHPSLEIIRYAKEHELDMIVMSTHGHSGLSHFLLGSVTERVVRKSPCPVLTVKSKQLTEYDEADD